MIPIYSSFNFGCSGDSMPPPTPELAYQIPLGYTADLDCVSNVYTTRIQISGGVPPYFFALNVPAQIIVISEDTIEIRIHTDITNPTTIVNGVSRCTGAYTAYMDRISGMGVFTADGPCIQTTCHQIRYNCFDQNIGSGILELSFDSCEQKEQDLITPMAVGYDPNIDYSNCSMWPDWPFPCQESFSAAPPTHPSCELPVCHPDNIVWQTYDYSSFCDGSIFANSNSFLDILAEVIANPGIGRCDVRHQDLKDNGNCSPCGLIQGTDILLTVTDSDVGPNALIVLIHVN